MQADRSSVYTPYPPGCPICGDVPNCPHQVLPPGETIFSGDHGSSVWIDPIAMGRHMYLGSVRPPEGPVPHQVRVNPKYPRSRAAQESDVTRTPTVPQPPLWQYDSPDYQVESSVPSLSLVVTELPTRPESFPPVSAMQSGPHSDKADTVPLPNRFLPVVQTPLPGGTANAQLTSWTAGGATRSVLARRIAERPKHRGKVKSSFNLFDRLRWWLLHPGRIEFLLWLGGTLLLMVVTCMLLLATALSFAWITPPFVSGDIATNSNVDVQNAQTVVTTPGLLLILTDTGPLVPGQVLHLRGQGFTAGGRVRFTHDTMQPILEQDGQPLTVQADTRGTFIASIPVGYPPAWATGKHILVVHDLTTNHLAALTFLLASGPMGQKATATPGPEVTPTTNDPGGFPTPNPVGQTPVPVSPTPTLSPTAGTTPTPQPSPTAATSPTPTPGTTPTANPSPTGSTSPTAVASHTANWSNANLGNDLGNTPYSTDQGSLFSPMMVSLLLTLLLLALLLLGLAGILRRHYR